jgi:hypothetical protein
LGISAQAGFTAWGAATDAFSRATGRLSGEKDQNGTEEEGNADGNQHAA